MDLEHLIATYGYLALFVGSVFEGETVLVLGGFLAHRGYLKLPVVIAVSFCATFLVDQLFFLLGRTKGIEWLEKRPRWKARSSKVLSLLQKHQIGLMLGFRFLYGLRTLTPFLLGAGGVSPGRFLPLNGIGASIWACALGLLGYGLGQALELFLEEAKRYELLVMGIIVFAGVAFWAIRKSGR